LFSNHFVYHAHSAENLKHVTRNEYPSTVQNPATVPTHQTRSDEKLRTAMDQSRSAFKYLVEKFPRLSEATIKEGVSVSPQIRKFFGDDMFNSLLQGDEKKTLRRVWSGLKLFFGNIRAENYKELIEKHVIVSQTWLQYDLKDKHASFSLGFVS
jgi:hypothetical protein